MLQLARESAAQEDLTIDFQCMTAERLSYENDTFDFVFVRDLLHHCVVHECMSEIVRVCKPNALVLIDELYTHSALQRLRNSAFGARMYSVVLPFIYHGDDPYITEDERKINEVELKTITDALDASRCRYFNAVVNRFVPDWDFAEIVDRALVRGVGPLAYFLAGRVLLTGRVKKSD